MPDLIIQHNETKENPNYELNVSFIAAIKELDISGILSRCGIRKDSRKLKGESSDEKRTAFEIFQFLLLMVFQGCNLYRYLGSKKQDIACSKSTYHRFLGNEHYKGIPAREGKTVYIGSSWKDVAYTDSEGKSKTITMRIVYEVIERTTDKNGQFLLVPDIECNTVWTNLGWSDDDIIKGYHAHGECEQFHSEIKTDMDVERLPSGKFDTNELVLELTVLAYNILRLIGQESLKSRRAPKTKHPVKRRRIRTVIGNLIQIAGHITTHGRRIVLAIGCSNVWRHAFMDVYNRFALA